MLQDGMGVIEGFYWDDGGRSASGYVGLAGDCVPRAISIVTGLAYRDVYAALYRETSMSPRQGVPVFAYSAYLRERGWIHHASTGSPVDGAWLPTALCIVECKTERQTHGHVAAIADGRLRDTWDVRDDGEYRVMGYWEPGPGAVVRQAGSEVRSHATDLTQAEFEKIIQRLRAIDNTAKNQATTDGERENALRMMQALMLRHNLSREDLNETSESSGSGYTRQACAVNGANALSWEKALANYVTMHVMPMVQYYIGRRGNRSLVFFYGPRWDVENAIALYRELLLTIATSARLLYGGHARGSGASYAEGYVATLPREDRSNSAARTESADPSSQALIAQRRSLAHRQAALWLQLECDISLVTVTTRGRAQRDRNAEALGRVHGAKHIIEPPSRPKGLPDRRSDGA